MNEQEFLDKHVVSKEDIHELWGWCDWVLTTHLMEMDGLAWEMSERRAGMWHMDGMFRASEICLLAEEVGRMRPSDRKRLFTECCHCRGKAERFEMGFNLKNERLD